MNYGRGKRNGKKREQEGEGQERREEEERSGREGEETGGRELTCPPPPKIREKYFSGNYYEKFGHFSGKIHVNSGILLIVGQIL